jgi:hypothetical protein
MTPNELRFRVLASGATQLWAPDVRPGDRRVGLGEEALEFERPLHVAGEGADQTVCGESVRHMREYAVEFAAQETRIRCPVCDQRLGHPLAL